MAILLLIALMGSFGIGVLYYLQLRQSIVRSPQLSRKQVSRKQVSESLLTTDRSPPPLTQPQQRVDNVAIASAKVSVIIPAYNEAENIEACILSVLNSLEHEPANARENQLTNKTERKSEHIPEHILEHKSEHKSKHLPEHLPEHIPEHIPEKCLEQDFDSSEIHLEVWVVDDQSIDQTRSIVQSLQNRLQDPRLQLIVGQPRPPGEVWAGKNWACAQAMQRATGDWLLFIDADVRLKPGAIATAIQYSQQEQIDLLSCLPAIVCGCLAEWLVQPLMLYTILVGFDFPAVNDPQTDTAFAAGPFMLFQRSAYEKVGGHAAIADIILEDVELARRIKFSHLNLRYMLGNELAEVRMYRSWSALWEGWTKNLYLCSQRNWRGTLKLVVLVLFLCPLPWLGLVLSSGALLYPLLAQNSSAIAPADWLIAQLGFKSDLDPWLNAASLLLSLIVIGFQYDIRRVGDRISQIPPRYWWLTGVGGTLVAAIALASIIKTETGWGWTWRGRSLKIHPSDTESAEG